MSVYNISLPFLSRFFTFLPSLTPDGELKQTFKPSPLINATLRRADANGRHTLTPLSMCKKRKGSKIITTNPLPHILDSVNHGMLPAGSRPSPLFSCAPSPQIPKMSKKEESRQRKKLKAIKKGWFLMICLCSHSNHAHISFAELKQDHGSISMPYNLVHRLRVDEELNWHDPSGENALCNFEIVQKLGEG